VPRTRHLPGGATSHCYTSHVDLMPTILGVAGVPLPSSHIDGEAIASLWPAERASAEGLRSAMGGAIGVSPCVTRATPVVAGENNFLSVCDGRYKLALGIGHKGCGGAFPMDGYQRYIRSAEAIDAATGKKLSRRFDGGSTPWALLFDLRSDAAEEHPLGSRNATRIANQLHARLRDWARKYGGVQLEKVGGHVWDLLKEHAPSLVTVKPAMRSTKP